MTDTRLRELERRWKETGSVENEAEYLRERVRVGDLTQERLELAAYCGHEGARRARSDSLGSPAVTVAWAEWARGIGRWGSEAVARSLIAIHALRWQRERDDPEVSWVPNALAALARWVLCPCPPHREAVVAYDGFPTILVREAADPRRASGLLSLQASTAASQLGGPALIKAEIVGALVPWALGISEPLARFVPDNP